MKRFVSAFTLVFLIALTFGHTAAAQKGGHQGTSRLDLVEATVPDLLKALQTNLITSEHLVEMYLARIAAYDDDGPKLNAFLTLNPNALAEARALDAARHPGIARSPLYIGYDSAGQHAAAALGIPAITVFAGHPNERFLRRWHPHGTGPRTTLLAGSPDLMERVNAAIDQTIGRN